MTVVWVTLAVLAGPVAYLLGHRFGQAKGKADADAEWRALVDEMDDELTDTRAKLDKRDQALATMQRNLDTVWDAGVVAGQTFQAEREAEGL